MRIGIIMGGKSIEREVSFNSGRTIYDHFDTRRYTPIPIFQRQDGQLFILPLRFIHRGKISDFEHRLAQEATPIAWDDLPQSIDFAFLMVHGRFAEDGTMQGMLELLGIPYLGTKLLGSALSMDKIAVKAMLRLHNILVPRDLDRNNMQYPCVVKPHKEGSSLGVSVVFEESQLQPAIDAAMHVNPGFAQPVLIEEKITGMEFTCIILLNKAGEPTFLPLTEIEHEPGSHFYTYEQKYMPGRAIKYTPARCTPEQTKLIQETCLQASRVLNFTTISRIDGFLTPDGKVYIVDPNTLTAAGPSGFFFRQITAFGMTLREVITKLIETELS